MGNKPSNYLQSHRGTIDKLLIEEPTNSYELDMARYSVKGFNWKDGLDENEGNLLYHDIVTDLIKFFEEEHYEVTFEKYSALLIRSGNYGFFAFQNDVSKDKQIVLDIGSLIKEGIYSKVSS